MVRWKSIQYNKNNIIALTSPSRSHINQSAIVIYEVGERWLLRTAIGDSKRTVDRTIDLIPKAPDSFLQAIKKLDVIAFITRYYLYRHQIRLTSFCIPIYQCRHSIAFLRIKRSVYSVTKQTLTLDWKAHTQIPHCGIFITSMVNGWNRKFKGLLNYKGYNKLVFSPF